MRPVVEIFHSIKLAVFAALGTFAQGFAILISWVDVSTLSTTSLLLGLILTSVLIVTHINRDRRERKKAEVDMIHTQMLIEELRKRNEQ
jgi:hypothetical protein